MFLVGGWATPLKNMNVSWDDDIPNILLMGKSNWCSKPPTRFDKPTGPEDPGNRLNTLWRFERGSSDHYPIFIHMDKKLEWLGLRESLEESPTSLQRILKHLWKQGTVTMCWPYNSSPRSPATDGPIPVSSCCPMAEGIESTSTSSAQSWKQVESFIWFNMLIWIWFQTPVHKWRHNIWFKIVLNGVGTIGNMLKATFPQVIWRMAPDTASSLAWT